MKDNSNKPRRRFKDRTIARILLTLLLTAELTKVFMNLSDKTLTHLGNVGSSAGYTQNYSLGLLNYVLIVPAALISFFVIKAVFYIVQKFILHLRGRINFNLDKQKTHRVLWDKVFPITAFLLGLLSIVSLLGITKSIFLLLRHPSTFDSYEALTEYYAMGIETGIDRFWASVGLFIPFDVTILIYVIIAYILRKKCAANGSERESLAKKGMITAVIFLVLSVPLGGLDILTSTIVYNAVYGSAISDLQGNVKEIHAATEDGYSISDLEVVYGENHGWSLRATGTITNTTNYDWEYVTFNVWFTDVTGNDGIFVKDEDKIPNRINRSELVPCTLKNIPSGGSVEFTSDVHALVYPSESDKFAKCKILNVEYKIVLVE